MKPGGTGTHHLAGCSCGPADPGSNPAVMNNIPGRLYLTSPCLPVASRLSSRKETYLSNEYRALLSDSSPHAESCLKSTEVGEMMVCDAISVRWS